MAESEDLETGDAEQTVEETTEQDGPTDDTPAEGNEEA